MARWFVTNKSSEGPDILLVLKDSVFWRRFDEANKGVVSGTISTVVTAMKRGDDLLVDVEVPSNATTRS